MAVHYEFHIACDQSFNLHYTGDIMSDSNIHVVHIPNDSWKSSLYIYSNCITHPSCIATINANSLAIKWLMNKSVEEYIMMKGHWLSVLGCFNDLKYILTITIVTVLKYNTCFISLWQSLYIQLYTNALPGTKIWITGHRSHWNQIFCTWVDGQFQKMLRSMKQTGTLGLAVSKGCQM